VLHPETRDEFRRVLTLCDFIYLVSLLLGVTAYAKSGNAGMPGFHARSMCRCRRIDLDSGSVTR
jgi:hypothetical protein